MDRGSLLAQLVGAGQESTAEKWAEQLGYDAQVGGAARVRECG